MSDRDAQHRHRWSVPPAVVDRIVLALYAACAVSVLLDFVIARDEKLAFAGSFGFYAWYGFVASAGLVLAAKGIRRLLMRSEDYYGEADD